MKAIVHIGTEKTGTSSIQKYLYLNRKKLSSAGYHVIQSAGKFNHRAIPAYCIRDDRFDDFFKEEEISSLGKKEEFKQRFIKEFESEMKSVSKNVHTFLISSEHFHSRIRSQEEMARVHKFLSAYFDDIRIVCYLREQVTTCTSYYSTHLKSSGTDAFNVFLRRCKPESYYFNYYEMLLNWRKFFGLQSLDVSLFAREMLLNGDLLDDFTAKIDPTLVGTLKRDIPVENESLTVAGQALSRAVNIAFPKNKGRAEFDELREKCQKVIADKLTGSGQQPDLATRKLIYDSFLESNELLRLKFFPKMDALFEPPVDQESTPGVIDHTFFDALTAIFQVLRKHGSDTSKVDACARLWDAVSISVHDATSAVCDMNSTDTKVTLNEQDARILRKSAMRIEGRDLQSAMRLMSIADEVSPELRGVSKKMEEYRQRGQRPQMSEYVITYHGEEKTLSPALEQQMIVKSLAWLASLDVPEGRAVTRLGGKTTIDSDGKVRSNVQPFLNGFSVIFAESMKEAIAIAKRCPHLEVGGTVMVSEVV